MDIFDRRLLTTIQVHFPLTVRPFRSLAVMLDSSEIRVLERIAALKEAGVIRQISAIFDSASIGYQSTLIAFRVPHRALARVAGAVSAHEGVSHNYQRECSYNLWFTLTVPACKDLRDEAAALAGANGIADWLFLPSLRKFKIRFQLDLTGEKRGGGAAICAAGKSTTGSRAPRISREFIRQLQRDFPLVSRPYRRIASSLKISEGEVVERAKRYCRSGIIRRIAAVLRHTKAGFVANVMVVWAPSPSQVLTLARCAARYGRISHCYERQAASGWPYSVYTMIHGHDIGECRAIVREISRESKVKRFRMLETVREFKKVRVMYFANNNSLVFRGAK